MLAEEVQEAKGTKSTVSREARNQFLVDVSDAMAEGPEKGEVLPVIEADREVCQHFLKGLPGDWNDTRCFIYNNVKVYERGHREAATRRERMSIEERNFGKSRR